MSQAVRHRHRGVVGQVAVVGGVVGGGDRELIARRVQPRRERVRLVVGGIGRRGTACVPGTITGTSCRLSRSAQQRRVAPADDHGLELPLERPGHRRRDLIEVAGA